MGTTTNFGQVRTASTAQDEMLTG
uniref:Uncharacterized protein n=1 Tax=Tetranychus urticae TaxID=32264 RepID=T1L397_TETUR